MGRAKDAMIEAMERGWSDPDQFVCDRCVGDEYLANRVRHHAQARRCDFCQRRGRSAIAAPTEPVLEAISRAIHLYYNEPNDAGVPWDGGYIVDPISTSEVLLALPIAFSDPFREAVEAAFDDADWVPSADGHWSTDHLSDQMRYSWSSFVRLVKHHTRYHFAHQLPADRQERSAEELLAEIGQAAEHLGLIRTLTAGTSITRVRIRQPGADWVAESSSMGAPPNERASAGRMNPAGISYFYGALEPETAIAEVVSSPPVQVVVAAFELERDIQVLDLSRLPPDPSFFDVERHTDRQWLRFLGGFAKAISQPVRKDGSEHVDYVPSQVISEWFAKVFELENALVGMRRLDGVLYPSAVAPSGRNLVLFPNDEDFPPTGCAASYRSHRELELSTWPLVAAALGLHTTLKSNGR